MIKSGPWKELEASTDFDGDDDMIDDATWEEMGPADKEDSEFNDPDVATRLMATETDLATGEKLAHIFFCPDKEAPGVELCKDADPRSDSEDAGSKVWFRFTYDDGTRSVVGGKSGCDVYYTERNVAQHNQFRGAIIGASCASNEPAGTSKEYPPEEETSTE